MNKMHLFSIWMLNTIFKVNKRSFGQRLFHVYGKTHEGAEVALIKVMINITLSWWTYC